MTTFHPVGRGRERQGTRAAAEEGTHASRPDADPPAAPVWIAPASKEQAEEGLFSFLRSLPLGRPRVSRPLLLESGTYRDFLAAPHPDLVEAFRRCLEHLLLDITPDTGSWDSLTVTGAVWGLALAAYNTLTPPWTTPGSGADPVDDHLAVLIESLPPARSVADLLAYHAILNFPATALPELPDHRARGMRALIDRSPLTSAYHPHLRTPPALTGLAAELLPGWRARVQPALPWSGGDEWLDVQVPLFRHPRIAAWLRRRWLALTPARAACRNLGLLLEGLRRRGGLESFLLEFYEAYCYLGAAGSALDSRERSQRHWPLLDRIAELLGVQGDSEAAIRLNRWGNEYLVLFRALLLTIIARNEVPREYVHLSPEFVLSLRRLLPLATDRSGAAFDLGNVAFVGEGEGGAVSP